MTGVERREKLLSMLAKSKEPIAGAEMAKVPLSIGMLMRGAASTLPS